jgi:hypothetical protein
VPVLYCRIGYIDYLGPSFRNGKKKRKKKGYADYLNKTTVVDTPISMYEYILYNLFKIRGYSFFSIVKKKYRERK